MECFIFLKNESANKYNVRNYAKITNVKRNVNVEASGNHWGNR